MGIESVAYNDEDIQKVREASDLVELFSERTQVKQRGRDFWCCCPVHNEKTPSCKINPVLQRWYCFGCGATGDVFTYIQKVEDLNFPDAVRYLADRYNIAITDSYSGTRVGSGEKARLREACAVAAQFYHLQLMRSMSSEAVAARTYLAGRNFGSKLCKQWNLGYAIGGSSLCDHLRSKGFSQKEIIDANLGYINDRNKLRDRFFRRIMFPIGDVKGDPIAFGGRVIGKGEPKYLNTSETPIFHKSEVLFGLHRAKASMASTGTALVCEGYTDVIALHEAGITFAVATLGTALTMRHIRVLSSHASKRIVYLFDGDEAGQRAADRALAFVSEAMTPEYGQARELVAVTLPDNLDPADFVAQRGAEELQELIDRAEPLVLYGIRRRLARYDLGTAEGRSAALVDALSVLAPIKSTNLAADYARQIASACRAREEDVLRQLAQLKIPQDFNRKNRRVSDKANYDTRGPAFDMSFASFGGRSLAQGSASQTKRLQGRGDASQQQGGNARPVTPVHLSSEERSRLRIEREVLALIVRRPLQFLELADKLAVVAWHDSLHRQVADFVYAELSENFNLSTKELVGRLTMKLPKAEKMLALDPQAVEERSDAMLHYLVDQLRLTDKEDELEEKRRLLLSARMLDTEEYEALFSEVVRLQHEISQQKLALSVKPL